MEARVESTIWLNFTDDLCTSFAGGHAELELLLLRCPYHSICTTLLSIDTPSLGILDSVGKDSV